ncbi:MULTISPECIES: CitMHS family transporter [unclassified Planococcus (in: firmicutes)]|uniref:CitMHS family transporter n=1 Tax=unclassified Planococcus (in: firmicutes) TaxID=2662419 RepID=UPI000C33A75E|nr:MULTISPECIES: citrate:proton symporter [unclassified Planococcus (in: firmicutes)]AUD13098.1 citrate transporter [Planococcus sp. MB-3u-03]PKG45419.1 citrate transporter [Planococcus sp. Urea-trap-24]PKG88985.1 citrate transporter [Planococcus sp. Urea-3u-39]PKH36353.1 citrate transporter [Planococcus sp. MB-3u-09]
MLALLGFLTIFVFLTLILTKKVSVIVSLILVPIVFALVGGFTSELGTFMSDGIVSVAPTGIMLGFAILFFGVMNNAGLFDPLISRVLKLVKGDPVKIVIGTVVIAMVAHLDGSGASTFLITIPALLPLYDKLGISRIILAGMVALGAGTMNLTPWGGPTARAASALDVSAAELFNPVIPAFLAGVIWIIFVAYIVGKRERKRLGVQDVEHNHDDELTEEQLDMRRPKLFWFNLALTVLTIVALVQVWLPLPIVFMVAFAIAVLVNYPKPNDQMEQIRTQSVGMITVVTIIFAAGIFTGILSGTGMITAMATALVDIIPENVGGFMGVLVAIIGMPLSLIFTPDAYYFGVMPILAETASAYGLDPVQIGQASILGQMTTGFPLSPLTASTFLLIGLAGVELADHQKFVFKWAFGTTIVMTIVAAITGVII